jgi:hypothetical protein
MTHHTISFPRFVPSSQMMKMLLNVIVIGGIIFLVGIVVSPERAWHNFLLSAYYLVSLGVGATIFLSFLYVSNAGWATAIRRVPEAIAASLPQFSLVLLATLFGIHFLYEWSHHDVVAHDAILKSKSGWLNVPFFSIRMVIILGIWILISKALLKNSFAQDERGEIEYSFRNKKNGALFLVAMGLTYWLASMDWIMSLEPHWYSTIYGIYHFSGTFMTSIAAITIVVILLRRQGVLANVVTNEHLFLLGKLLFGFSTFWAYIWFSQYLLIWYANIPEEVVYFNRREHGGWIIFTIANVLFNWIIPFFVLLPQWTKRNEGLLLKVCIVVMIGHWIDLFWMILPPLMKEGPQFSIWEIGILAAAISAFFYFTFRAFSKNNSVPNNDPLLVESLPHHS